MGRLRIAGLHKHYGKVHAVRGVDLDIPEGEFTVLVGPSGCGKSTMLRMIAGLEDIDEGLIEIDGEAVNDVRPRDRNLAMVFQNYALYPYMNVFDNIAFGLRARKTPKDRIEERVREAAGMLGITELLERLPRELSGGQRQRVAIGRAIVRDARLFLFDEPLSNLDAQLRDELRGEIKRMHRELGKTMIYVTHDQVEAMTLADRIVLLRDGAIEQQGAPVDLYERPHTKFVAGFLGSPTINLLPVRLVETEAEAGAEGGGGGLAASLDGGPVLALPEGPDRGALAGRTGEELLLGIRAQHIGRLADGGTAARPGSVPVEVEIDLAQPTGSRTYCTFKLGGVETVAELDVHEAGEPGDRMTLGVDMRRAVLIDPRTERVVWHAGSGGAGRPAG